MMRCTRFRFVAITLFAMAAAALTTPSAKAFSLENVGTAGGGNASFADPDDQIGQKFGLAQDEGSSSLSSPAPRSGKLNPYKNFHFDSLTTPPDPLSRPGN